MGIETTLPNRKDNKDFYQSPVETNSITKTRKCRRRHRKMSPVQKLYETCKVVFSLCGAGIVPSSDDIQKLCSVLGTYFCYCMIHKFLISAYKWSFGCYVSEFHNRIELELVLDHNSV